MPCPLGCSWVWCEVRQGGKQAALPFAQSLPHSQSSRLYLEHALQRAALLLYGCAGGTKLVCCVVLLPPTYWGYR